MKLNLRLLLTAVAIMLAWFVSAMLPDTAMDTIAPLGLSVALALLWFTHVKGLLGGQTNG